MPFEEWPDTTYAIDTIIAVFLIFILICLHAS